MGDGDEAVRVPFRIHTRRGVLEASVRTTEAPIPVVDVIDAARGLDDALIGLALQQAEEDGAPATCRQGCTACCHHPVPLSAAEAYALAARIEAMPPERRAAVERRFDEVRAQVDAAGLLRDLEATLDGAAFERIGAWISARIPCPLLDEGSCTIYADRPLACREHLVSTEPAWCSDPAAPVRSVPLLARLARALTRVSAEAWPDAPARIPLLLAPAWARRHAEEAGVRRSGVALLERLLRELR